MRKSHPVPNRQRAVLNATENLQTHTGARTRRVRNGFLGLTAAAALTAAALLGTALGPAAASAATTPSWLMGAGTLSGIHGADPALTSQVLNTPATYGAGSSVSANPVQPGQKATPVLGYTSYARFASDIANSRIAFPYKWVMYDPEKWSKTPVSEQQNPYRYMALFGQLAHAHGLKVIMAPAMDLGYVPGAVTPRQPGETIVHWYIRANIGGASAAGDIVDVQNETQTTNLQQYDAMFNAAAAQAHAANPAVQVYAEVSTVNGTVAQMTTAAESVSPDGYYLAAPGAIPQAVQFLKNMQAAGR
jgi:hypothetical protein